MPHAEGGPRALETLYIFIIIYVLNPEDCSHRPADRKGPGVEKSGTWIREMIVTKVGGARLSMMRCGCSGGRCGEAVDRRCREGCGWAVGVLSGWDLVGSRGHVLCGVG